MTAFSVLDLSPIRAGEDAPRALRETIAFAQHAEALGARRVWLAEHHNAGTLASSSPEILIGQVAAATQRIRVGAGGVMLPNHSPLRVAEQFRLLEALFPGRIDLGLGRAAGTDPRTARALRRGVESSSDDFAGMFDELAAYLDDRSTPRGPRPTSIVAIPSGVGSPLPFLLGSSDYGATFAAARGLGFAFAHHMNPREAATELRRYRAAFLPSRSHGEPLAIASVSVIAAASDADAEELAASGRLALVRMSQGQRDLPFPSVSEALAHAFDEEELAVIEGYRDASLIGGPDRVRAGLRALLEASGADELVVLTQVHDGDAKRASLALVAEILASEGAR